MSHSYQLLQLYNVFLIVFKRITTDFHEALSNRISDRRNISFIKTYRTRLLVKMGFLVNRFWPFFETYELSVDINLHLNRRSV